MRKLTIYLKSVSLFEVFFLIFITLAAYMVRIKGITDTGLWNDELWTVYFSSARHIETVWEMLAVLSSKLAENPPLYPLIMRGWVYFLGDSEVVIRLPSVIFGSLSVPVFYVCLSQIVKKRVSAFSSILLVFSPVHIHYSQEARTYALFFLLSLLSMYFFFKLNKSFTKRNALGYVAVATLMLYSHYYAIFLLVGQAAILLFSGKYTWRWLVIALGTFIFFAPWLPSFVNQTSSFSLGSWIGRIGVGEGLISQVEFFTPHMPAFPLDLIFKLLFTLGLVKVIVLSVKREYSSVILLAWLFIPVLIPLVVSQFTQPFFVDRYSFITLAAFLAIAALGMDVLVTFNRMFLIPLWVVLFFLMLSSQFPFLGADTESWREAVPFAEESLAGSDAPVAINFDTPAIRTALTYYTKGGKINLISQEDLRKKADCYERLYLFSRSEVQNIVLKCRYQKVRTLFSGGPYLYEYEVRN